MNKCEVRVIDCDKRYEGQYEINDNILVVEIFDFYPSGEGTTSYGNEVKYEKMVIMDLKNNEFYYSPVFYNIGTTYSLTQYEKYKTDFYFFTYDVNSIDAFGLNERFSAITVYNPMLANCYSSFALEISYNQSEYNYLIHREPKNVSVEIKQNNIEKIEFGSSCTWNNKFNNQLVNIETENFAKIFLVDEIDYDDIFTYVNELDVMINAFCLVPMHSYRVKAYTKRGKVFNVVHRILGKDKFTSRVDYRVVNIDFYTFIENMYKRISYRNEYDRNECILLDIKRPISLEDQFIFYFRYIDFHMGKKMSSPTGNRPSNYKRISTFVDNYSSYFNKEDYCTIDDLKIELNSIRNHFIHEGYYFVNGEFDVTDKSKKVLYRKKMDYAWLFRIVKTLKYCSYLMMYKEVLLLDINEVSLRRAMQK